MCAGALQHDSTAQRQHRQHAMDLGACAAETGAFREFNLLHVSGGGGGDPLVPHDRACCISLTSCVLQGQH